MHFYHQYSVLRGFEKSITINSFSYETVKVIKGSLNGTLDVILLPTMCRYSCNVHDISADSLLPSMYKGVAGRMSYDQKSCKNMKAVLIPKKL